LDKTGLTGNYNFSLRWTPSETEAGMSKLMGSKTAAESAPSSESPLFTAIQEQLGLTLEPQTESVQVLVIDQVEKPSEN
jgi:uncharacterized protein (TIGR03435 family)